MRGGDQILAAILATIDRKVRGAFLRRMWQTFQTGHAGDFSAARDKLSRLAAGGISQPHIFYAREAFI